MTIIIPTQLSDDALMAAAARLAGDEREVAARLVAHLAEIDRRALYLPAGYSSLYYYCREALGYSDDAAYNRTTAAKVARRYPSVIDMLADGRLHLTAVKLLAPILKDDTWERTLAEAAGLTKRDIEKLVARLDPKPDVPSTIRRIAAPRVAQSSGPVTALGATAAAPDESGVPGEPISSASAEEPALSSAPAAVPERPDGSADQASGGSEDREEPQRSRPATKRAIVAPLAPERYRVQFTIGEETEKKLRRLQTLLKREIPDGDPGLIFDRALTLLLARVEGRKLGLTTRPRAGQASGQASRRVAAPRSGTAAADEGARTAGSPGAHGRSRRPRTMPAGTRRVVGRRDEERCTFVGADGRRCTERAYLEYHHAGKPFAHGGTETATNIALHCRAHNAYEGARIFGRPLPREIREARVLYDAMMFPVPERRP